MEIPLDLSDFQLHRVDTPSWAAHAQTFTDELDPGKRDQVSLQRVAILQKVEEILRWALTDPEPIQHFYHSFPNAEGVKGDYFTGRQHFWVNTDGQLIIETECCLTRNTNGQLEVYTQFLVLLLWDLAALEGHYLLASRVAWNPVLSTPTLRRIGISTLDEVAHLGSSVVTSQMLQFLEARWESVLQLIHDSGQDYLDHGSASGLLGDNWFPSRLEMTGEYFIHSLWTEATPIDGFYVQIHFIAYRRQAQQTDFGQLGLTLNMGLAEEKVVCEHADSYVAWTSENDPDDQKIIAILLTNPELENRP